MHNARYKTRYFPFSIFIVVGVLVWVLMAHYAIAWTAATYTDSAHGNASYGVNRSGTGYPIGSCAHCHDTFDSGICGNDVFGFMLFASNDNPASQTGNFCFECHEGFGSVQVRDGGLKNHTYSTNFGGGTATFTTIYDAFNPPTGATPSSHNLADVLSHAVGRDIGFSSNTNPCLVCHDHHLAQQNYPVTLSGSGGVKTAIRRPLDFASPPTNLWGDEDATSGNNERMRDYTAKYQAPYYLGGSNYEPANDSTADGSNLPNFKNFCTNNCHGVNGVYSTEHGRNLTKIDWSVDGETRHGKYHGGVGWGYTIAPYEDPDEDFNYILSCTDCHETHGSENEWLLRTCVNGKDNIQITESGRWLDFCTACHVLDGCNCWHDGNGGDGAAPTCDTCHLHGQTHPNGL